MTHTLKILHKSHIPGTAGYTTAGVPKQNKMRVVAELDITSYTAAGEVVTKNKLGLETIDSIVLESKEFVNTATLTRLYAYERSNDKVLVYAVDTAGGSGDELVPATTSADLGQISIVAIGDARLPTEVTVSDSINSVTGTPLA